MLHRPKLKKKKLLANFHTYWNFPEPIYNYYSKSKTLKYKSEFIKFTMNFNLIIFYSFQRIGNGKKILTFKENFPNMIFQI